MCKAVQRGREIVPISHRGWPAISRARSHAVRIGIADVIPRLAGLFLRSANTSNSQFTAAYDQLAPCFHMPPSLASDIHVLLVDDQMQLIYLVLQ